ncbi:ATP-binding protein [Ignavigranum ruoffiae]|uniref:ATP-binding protein n=1 Tax=Ignavigranum ruoffiae TaxID=89093 RepID=UPI002355CA4D|nr:ATP-binding protein [Ignavigranum ruoffiae]
MMNSISQLINLKGLPKIEDIKTALLEDAEIKEFIREYEDVITDDMINSGLSVLNEYKINRNDPHYKCKLMLYAGQISIVYKMRDVALEQRYRDKVPAKLRFDITTSKFRGISLKDAEEDLDNIKAKNFLEEFVEVYSYGAKLKGLWLCGKFGIGKSYLLGGFANDLHKKGVGVAYLSASQMVDDFYQSIRSDSGSFESKLNYLMKTEVLILDDLGTEKATSFTIKRILYPLMKYRGEYNKPTFITSNLTKDDYWIHLNNTGELSRIDIGRLKEQTDVLMTEMQMGGRNRRVKA